MIAISNKQVSPEQRFLRHFYAHDTHLSSNHMIFVNNLMMLSILEFDWCAGFPACWISTIKKLLPNILGCFKPMQLQPKESTNQIWVSHELYLIGHSSLGISMSQATWKAQSKVTRRLSTVVGAIGDKSSTSIGYLDFVHNRLCFIIIRSIFIKFILGIL